MMEFTPEQKAALAAGLSLATTIAGTANPLIGGSIQAATAILAMVQAKGEAMTIDDFIAAVTADGVARADSIAAEAEARAK